jgi:chemotaxis protein histidine kinase CheA
LLASGREEFYISRRAERLADKELDLAFADALLEASQKLAEPTPEARELMKRATQAQALVDSAEARVARLKQELAAAKPRRADELQRQVELARAEVELAHDELEDAKSGLRRAGADPESRVRRQFERHQAAQHEGEAANSSALAPPASAEPNVPANVVSQFSAWYAVREAMRQVSAAREEALAASITLKEQHDAREQKLTSAPSPSQSSVTGAARELATLQQRAQDQKVLSRIDKRMDAVQELADVYASWTNSLRARQARALHGLLRGTLAILLILLVLYSALRAVDHFVPDLAPERTRMRTLRGVIRFALQAVGVLLVALVIFGTPNQISTIVGLAGAGLTVALKDFIVSFLGWFVLMGRNGIRPGDWVEINGVTGEVVEINLLRTVLLETGNWTETGHPTGRKVAFMNGYAIEGHFFNFSTAGQWLWDELKITLPATENPYPVMESIQQLVAAETEANSRTAEQEWQRAAGRYASAQPVTATPVMNVRPAGGGVELCVRYVSRANERPVTRARLYQAVFQLLHHEYLPADAQNTNAQNAAAAHSSS